MKLINRSAFAILPLQPFVDWANRQTGAEFNQPMSLAEHRAEGTVYLVDEFQDEADIQQALGQQYARVFENELAAWDEFGDNWPQNRTLEMFHAWFEVQPQVMVVDLLSAPLMTASLEE